MEQPIESNSQFVHFQHGCPTLSREEQVVLFHALRNQGVTIAVDGTMTITDSVIHGPVAGINFGTMQSIIQLLPKPLDPLPAALAALAAIPLDDVPAPHSDLPQASRLPFEASPHFVGREEALKQLAAAIGTTQSAVVMPAVATGLGGIGKTSLVTEFAYRYGGYFHGGVFWLNCADPDQVAGQIAACARDLGIDPTGMMLDEQVQRVLIAWKSPMPRLLIFDNCDDPAILQHWKPTVGGCRVLVTARSDQWPTLTQIRLGVLSPAESRLLLQRLCARLSDGEADAIAEDLGHLPLALHLAGSYLATYPHHTVEQYRKDLTITHKSLKGRGALPSPTRHEQDVEATFMLSFKQLDPNDALDTLALGMLDGAAWCAPGVPIPRALVLAFVPDGTDADDAVDALRRLQQLGLLDGMDAVVLHRLLAQVIFIQIGSPATLAVVEEQLSSATSLINYSSDISLMLPLEPHLRYITSRALKRGDMRAVILANSLGLYEDHRGMYDASIGFHKQSLTITNQILGNSHPETASVMSNLAIALSKQGSYEEARALHEQALLIRKQVLGKQHPETMTTMNNLGVVFLRQGRYGDAQSLHEEVLVIRQKILGETHPDTAQSLSNLAMTLIAQAQYARAKILLNQALVICLEVYGAMHRDTITCHNNLAMALSYEERYDEASSIYKQVVIACQTVFGEDHPLTVTSRNNLAMVLGYQGYYDEAVTLYKDVLAMYRKSVGELHPWTASALCNLAWIREKQACYSDAQTLHEQALAIRKNVLGLNHSETALSLNNLAGVLLRQGFYNDALMKYEEAYKIARHALGELHPQTQRSKSNMLAVQDRLYRNVSGDTVNPIKKIAKKDVGKGWK